MSKFCFSQTQGLNFQGVARNASGVILASQNISLKFSILQTSATGNAEYVESRTVATNSQGIFSIVIGDGTGSSVTGAFNNINWKLFPKFLKVEMDPVAGSNYITMGTTQIQSVPYANYSEYSASVDANNIVGLVPVARGGTGSSDLTTLKTNLDLGNVNNTADLNKPISTATQIVLNTKANTASITSSLSLKEDLANKSTATDLGGINASDILYPTQKAVKVYVAANQTAGGVVDGGITAIKLADGAVTDAKMTSVSGTKIIGNITSATWSGTTIDIAHGGTGATSAAAARANLGLVIGTNVQAALTAGTDYLAPNGSAANLTNFPSLNQNTTGNAATATYASSAGTASSVINVSGINTGDQTINLTGDVTGSGTGTFTTTIGTGKVTNNMLEGNITSSKFIGTDISTVGTITIGTWSGTIIDVAHGGTGSSSKNFVDLSTAQTINGLKTFASDGIFNGVKIGKGGSAVLQNTALGYNALQANTIGMAITSVGYNSLLTNSNGMANTSVGYNSLKYNDSGGWNTSFGVQALEQNNVGNGNTAIGYISLYHNTVGNYNTAIGYGSDVGSDNLTNATAIGKDAIVNASNTIQLGNGNITNVATAGTITAGAITYPNTNGSDGQVLTATVSGSITWTGGSHFIGESYGGGKVFYVYDNGKHGLIAATSDQNSGSPIRWYGGSNTNTRARAEGIGAGLKNTSIIIANQGAVDGNSFAATICNEYSVTETIGGITTTYGDWYLPSKYELYLLYLNKDAVGGFLNSYYWSSCENGNLYAWAQGFGFGNQAYENKSTTFYVRAIRSF